MICSPVRTVRLACKFTPILLAATCVASGVLAQERYVAGGLAIPESALVGHDRRVYVSQIGEPGKNGDGSLAVINRKGGKDIFAAGLDDPKGLSRWKHYLYVADEKRIWKIDPTGNATAFVQAKSFPRPPLALTDLAFDSRGNLYVSDAGDTEKGGGAIYKITPRGKVSLLISAQQEPRLGSPSGLLFERPGKLLVIDFVTGELYRIDLKKRSLEPLAGGFGGGYGLALSRSNQLYVSDWKNGKLWRLDLSDRRSLPVVLEAKCQAPADLAFDGRLLMVPDSKAGTLTWLAVK